jgi:hypothetical protein
MKRFFIGALWGMIFYFVGYVLVTMLVEAPAGMLGIPWLH